MTKLDKKNPVNPWFKTQLDTEKGYARNACYKMSATEVLLLFTTFELFTVSRSHGHFWITNIY